MTRKNKPNPEDLVVFHEAMKGTQPIKRDKIPLKSKQSQIKRQKPHTPKSAPLLFSDHETQPPVHGDDLISYAQNGISHKTLRNLQKGQYNVEAILDLHHKTVDEARSAIEDFMQSCKHRGIKLCLIIHGKGHRGSMPILKNKLNNWLRDLSTVLAFCSATPKHGGRGAIYVLLKRNQTSGEDSGEE